MGLMDFAKPHEKQPDAETSAVMHELFGELSVAWAAVRNIGPQQFDTDNELTPKPAVSYISPALFHASQPPIPATEKQTTYIAPAQYAATQPAALSEKNQQVTQLLQAVMDIHDEA
jgi:hypothetical protein